MTTLLAWLGVDQRAPSSAYIASDSRLSNNIGRWDNCRKVFAARARPELLGYCGSVMFPSQVLGQLIDVIDLGLLDDARDAEAKCSLLDWHFNESFSSSCTAMSNNGFSIIYITRIGEYMKSTFHAFEWTWRLGEGWKRAALPLPTRSGLIASRGSGEHSLASSISKRQLADPRIERTSRLYYIALVDSITNGLDTHSGGPPQLIGIGRKGPAKTYGVIHKDTTTAAGLPVDGEALGDRLAWRNDLFENCCGKTRRALGPTTSTTTNAPP